MTTLPADRRDYGSAGTAFLGICIVFGGKTGFWLGIGPPGARFTTYSSSLINVLGLWDLCRPSGDDSHNENPAVRLHSGRRCCTLFGGAARYGARAFARRRRDAGARRAG